ncbi:MAG: hypothetical protein ACYC5G_01215 [Candidatus Doudnabacteria bacterium]
MSFVNPLGNLGHSTQPLPDMTAGIQALQRTEIQRKLQQIQQDRAWERDDRLRNEKETLEMMDIPKADFVTKTEIDKFAKGQQDYTQFITDLNKQKKGKLDINDKIAIMQKKNELVGTVMRGKAFRDSFTEYQKNIIGTRSKLKDPDEIARFDAQQAALAKKMANPNYEPSAYDLIEAQQVPEPSANVVFAETTKSLLPFVDSSVKDAGNGRTQVDKDKLMQAIKTNVSPSDYLYTKGVEEGKWGNPDEMYNKIAERLAPSIKTDVTGWKPTQEKEANVVVEVPTYIESVDPKVMSGEGVSIPRSGRAFSVTIGQGEDKTAAKFTPTQYVDGVLQGEFKGVKYVKREGVDAVQAKRDAKGDARIKVTNIRTIGGKQVADVTAPEIDTWYGSVPYGQVRDEVKDRFPTVDAKYNAEIGAKSAKQIQQRSDVTQDQYAKLKKGETYFYQGKEYTKK